MSEEHELPTLFARVAFGVIRAAYYGVVAMERTHNRQDPRQVKFVSLVRQIVNLGVEFNIKTFAIPLHRTCAVCHEFSPDDYMVKKETWAAAGLKYRDVAHLECLDRRFHAATDHHLCVHDFPPELPINAGIIWALGGESLFVYQGEQDA